MAAQEPESEVSAVDLVSLSAPLSGGLLAGRAHDEDFEARDKTVPVLLAASVFTAGSPFA